MERRAQQGSSHGPAMIFRLRLSAADGETISIAAALLQQQRQARSVGSAGLSVGVVLVQSRSIGWVQPEAACCSKGLCCCLVV